MPFRFAQFILDGSGERTPSGGLKVPARLARTGLQTYHRPDGSQVIEYRPEEEVFSEDSIASWRGAPVTDFHPSGPVTPESWADVAKGHVGEDVRRDGDFLAATLYLQDGDLIKAVQEKRRQDLSGGYQVDVDDTPGTVDGQRFDRIQRNIRGNHVAALPPGAGRAGTDVAIRLDSSDNAIIDTAPRGQEERTMITIRIDGVDYEIEGPGAAALKQALERKDAADSAALAAAKATADQAAGRADAADSTVKELQDKLAAATAPAAVQAAAERRTQLVMDARTIMRDPKADFAGLDDAAIMRTALGETVKADASEDYLRGAFKATLKAAKADASDRQDAEDSMAAARLDAEAASRGNADGNDPMDKLETDLAQRRADAWKQTANPGSAN